MNMTEWIQKQYVVAGIAAVCLVSMLVKCLIRYKYRAMLREVQLVLRRQVLHSLM